MSTLAKTDPVADKILDLISEHESAGNYNAVIGDAKATKDLGQYDISGINILMDGLRNAGHPSTAVGRYQFIRATLKGVVRNLGLSDTTKFTPEVQDQLCVGLLNNTCAFLAWRSGGVPDERFAHLLSAQWASLPDPQNGGKSHYDGDSAGNHAGTNLTYVYMALVAARGTVLAPPVRDNVAEAVKALQAALSVPVDGLMDKDGATLKAYFAYRAKK